MNRWTGSEVASTIARAFASVSARPIAPSASGRPRENANPALVVASASNPSVASILAEPASQGLGIANAPGLAWRDWNASARAANQSKDAAVDAKSSANKAEDAVKK